MMPTKRRYKILRTKYVTSFKNDPLYVAVNVVITLLLSQKNESLSQKAICDT